MRACGGRRGLRTAMITAAMLLAGAAPAYADADLVVGIEPYGTGVQQHAYGLADGEQRDLDGFVQTRDSATNVKVQVDVPAGVTLHSATPSQGSFDPATNVWDVGVVDTVGAGAPGLLLRVSRTAPGDHDLKLRVIASSEPDPNPANDEFTATIREPVTRWVKPNGATSGDCLTIATACEIRWAADGFAPHAALPGDTVRVLPGDYPFAQALSLAEDLALVGDDPAAKARFVNLGTQTLLIVSPDSHVADIELVDDTTATGNSALSLFPGTSAERVLVTSTRRAVNMGLNASLRDSIVVGNHATFGAIRTTQAGTTADNVTAINLGQGPAVEGNVLLHNTIARSAGPFDLQNVGAATFSNFGTSTNSVAPGSGSNQTTAPSFTADYHQAPDSVTLDAGEGDGAGRRDVDGGLRKAGVAVDIGGDERGAVAQVTPNRHDFGELVINGVRNQTFTLKNVGPTPMKITQITESAEFQRVPEQDECGPETLAPGESCTFGVDFRPTSSGPKAFTLIVGSAQAGDTPVFLTGTATGQAGIELTPASAAYGDVAVSQSSTKTFTVKSTGAVPLTVGTPSVSGSGEFSVSRNTCTDPLAANATCEIDVTFSPASVGDKSASLTVPSNAPGGAPSASLTGKGVIVDVATTLTARPVTLVLGLLDLRMVVSATLRVSASGAPVAGQTVAFTDSLGGSICQATTNASGVASCSTLLNVAAILGYDARFAGAVVGGSRYLPSAGRASGVTVSFSLDCTVKKARASRSKATTRTVRAKAASAQTKARMQRAC
ncbi:MAG TPA: choice-of-anchor D domain-containing protein [Solirubrobacteraceae bacterium]